MPTYAKGEARHLARLLTELDEELKRVSWVLGQQKSLTEDQRDALEERRANALAWVSEGGQAGKTSDEAFLRAYSKWRAAMVAKWEADKKRELRVDEQAVDALLHAILQLKEQNAPPVDEFWIRYKEKGGKAATVEVAVLNKAVAPLVRAGAGDHGSITGLNIRRSIHGALRRLGLVGGKGPQKRASPQRKAKVGAKVKRASPKVKRAKKASPDKKRA